MKAEIGMVWPQAKEYWSHQKVKETGNRIFPREPGGSAALLTP